MFNKKLIYIFIVFTLCLQSWRPPPKPDPHKFYFFYQSSCVANMAIRGRITVDIEQYSYDYLTGINEKNGIKVTGRDVNNIVEIARQTASSRLLMYRSKMKAYFVNVKVDGISCYSKDVYMDELLYNQSIVFIWIPPSCCSTHT